MLVMRRPSSPPEAPTKASANTDNVDLERQLDDAGRAVAAAMGKALRALKIEINEVLTSPTYRALETVRFAELLRPVQVPELGDGGRSMQGVTEAQTAWLRSTAAERPRPGGNRVIVTHQPNLARAFPDWGRRLPTARR